MRVKSHQIRRNLLTEEVIKSETSVRSDNRAGSGRKNIPLCSLVAVASRSGLARRQLEQHRHQLAGVKPQQRRLDEHGTEQQCWLPSSQDNYLA